MVRAGIRSISVGITALAIGFALKLGGTYATRPANAGWQGPGISVYGTIHPKLFDFRTPLGSHLSDDLGVRVASLETGDASDAAAEEETELEASASFDQRFFFNERVASFDERFAGAAVPVESAGADGGQTERRAAPARDPVIESIHPVVRQSAAKLASLAPPQLIPADRKGIRRSEEPSEPAAEPDLDNRTAIYDIAAHTVYLPDGRRLEAHSGLGSHMDDPRYVNVRLRGPTPPNVYKLALREELFHGVRALRLNPVDDSKMHGRAGMLAHSYMLGPNGQSNGCVSFSNYPAFLNAFLKGEVDRLIVVEHLASAPTPKTASRWFPEAIKKLFETSERAVGS